MKIAIVVNPLIPVPPEKYGGIERIVFMLIQELKFNGHDITLFAHSQSQAGCNLIPYTEAPYYGLLDIIRINILTSKISFNNFDLVHTFGRMSNIALLMLSKIPKIVSYQLPPTISQLKRAVKLSRNNSLYFTACSNFIANQISLYGNVTTIYNGVNTLNYDFNNNVSEDAPLVFLGRIQKEKGTHIAIEVAKRTDRKLIIAGNIPLENIHQHYFNEMVKPCIDDNQIIYIGAVNDEQKNDLLGNAFAFLMPVTWGEPFGIVMAEALACGTPVIGFRQGAIPEIVIDGVNGFVCNNTDEMIDAVNRIELIDRSACRKIAEEKFSSTVLGRQYEQLYFTITAKR